MNIAGRDLLGLLGALALLGCTSDRPDLPPNPVCMKQVSGTYDSVVLARFFDDTLWVAPNSATYTRIDNANAPIVATDCAASGSSAYGAAVGCAIAGDGTWCFPLAGPVLDSTSFGAGLGQVTTNSALQVVTAKDAGAPPLRDAVQLAGGMNGGGATFCAVTSDGKLWCWGYNTNAYLGHGDSDSANYARPVMLDPGTEFTQVLEVRVGFDSTCARKADGTVWCWGNNGYAELGHLPASDPEQSAYPIPVTLPAAAIRLAASPGNTHCAILADTSVVCWGRNEYAQAGAASVRQAVPPTLLQVAAEGPAFKGVLDLAPDRGMRAMCANTGKPGLWCWGDVLEGNDAGSPYPLLAASAPNGRIDAPMSASGARDGKLIYVNPNGRLVFGAGATPTTRQPPCP